MKFIKDHYIEIITYAICTVVTLLLIALGVWAMQAIWASDLPDWLKLYLITH